MTFAPDLWITLLPLMEEGPAREDVKAGWTALLVVLGLAAAVVFLAFSLRKHLGRVDFEEQPDKTPEQTNGQPPAAGPTT